MDDQEMQQAAAKQDAARVYNAGLNLLARREHSSKELKQKLGRRFVDALVDEACAGLKHNGLLSDERFAEAVIHSRTAKGYGPRHIAQELSQKGVAKEVIKEFLDERDAHWVGHARDAALKKLRTTSRLAEAFRDLQNDAAGAEEVREHQQQMTLARQKLSAFLGRRGFSSEMVRAALAEEFPSS
jgi:regulatory protein